MNTVGLRAVLFFFEPVGRFASFLIACAFVILVLCVNNAVAAARDRGEAGA